LLLPEALQRAANYAPPPSCTSEELPNLPSAPPYFSRDGTYFFVMFQNTVAGAASMPSIFVRRADG
jgi:hypothetical protein